MGSNQTIQSIESQIRGLNFNYRELQVNGNSVTIGWTYSSSTCTAAYYEVRIYDAQHDFVRMFNTTTTQLTFNSYGLPPDYRLQIIAFTSNQVQCIDLNPRFYNINYKGIL